MRRFFIVFVLVAAIGFLHTASARDVAMRRLATVELQRDSLVHNDSMRTVELLVQKRTSLGTFQSIRLYDIISVLPAVKSTHPASLIVVCESSDGRTCATSFAELDPALAKLPPLLLIGANTESGPRQDSLSLADRKGMKGTVDLAGLQKRFSSVTRLRYVMNDAELTGEERKQFRNLEMRLLFPYDRSPLRWLPDIKYIHVYIAE